MTPTDVHLLSGAYALDALDEDERAGFENHLAHCPACAEETRELAATAGRLGLAATVTPPPALKRRVMREITTIRQEAPRPGHASGGGSPVGGGQTRGFPGHGSPGRGSAGRWLPARWLPARWGGTGADGSPGGRTDGSPGARTGGYRGARADEYAGARADGSPDGRSARGGSRWVLAVCLAVAAVLGGTTVWQHQEAERARDQARSESGRLERLTGVLTAPDARTRSAAFPDGARGTVVASRARDKAVFIGAGMPRPPAGKVYQLWYDDGGTMRSAGLMEPARGDQAVLLDGPLGGASGVGITVEPAGGSPGPTSDPVGLVPFGA
ncbi:anti-sigma factor domain-containing protein [Streptomyces uncialis]|uniref:anti-sigma factor n=1 Tax=Streptomyces uncialis TaxID=1048205 RepID=UPI003829C219